MGRLVDIEDVKALLLGLDSLPWEEEIDDLVETIPTAYDVEGVVSKLQYMKENFEKDCSYWKEHSWRDNAVYNEADLNDRQADCYADAIEIVRKGGVE